MYLDIFDIVGNYHGIQRQHNSLFKTNQKEWEKYFSLMDEERIPYTLKNIYVIWEILSEINKKDNLCELLVYGSDEVSEAFFSLEFLGYDISGSSIYLSPIKTVFYDSENVSPFNTIRNNFSTLINSFGLFQQANDAAKFISCIEGFAKNNLFENDGKLSIIKVYRIETL